MVFRAPVSIDALNALSRGTLIEHLGIVFTEAGEDWVRATMPVDPRTRQPAGVLHGGVSVVFAETLASWASAYVVNPDEYHCVGQEINANHLRAVVEGWVYGVARPLHLGRSSHVWDVRISNEADRLVCVSRVTMAVLKTPGRY